MLALGHSFLILPHCYYPIINSPVGTPFKPYWCGMGYDHQYVCVGWCICMHDNSIGWFIATGRYQKHYTFIINWQSCYSCGITVPIHLSIHSYCLFHIYDMIMIWCGNRKTIVCSLLAVYQSLKCLISKKFGPKYAQLYYIASLPQIVELHSLVIMIMCVWYIGAYSCSCYVSTNSEKRRK